MTRQLYLFIFFLIFCLSILSCNLGKKQTEKSAFELIEAEYSGVEFTNNVKSQKDFNVLTYRNYYNGGGVGIGDLNNDGLKDLYFTANLESNKLYLNKGNFKFDDVTDKSGTTGKKAWCTGVTMVDVNADGWLDIYVCYSGEVEGVNKENELFINQKNGIGKVPTFKQLAKEYGLNDAGLSTHASFFDYDLDGDLDCFVLNNSYKDPERIALFKRERIELGAEGGDRLYRNDGANLDSSVKFTDVTSKSGLFSSNTGFGLGISVGDVNGDYWPDIYISNDFWERDYLYINNKNGTFSEQLTDRMSYTSVSSMGSDMADINNDGNLDIFSTDMLPPDNYRLKAATKFDDYYLENLKFKNSYFHQFVQNCLQVNKGNGQFQETAFYSGLAATDWSWGALIFDMNLDGKKDVFISNGVYQDITNSDFIDFIANKENISNIVKEKGRYDFRDFEKYLPNNKRSNYAYINDSSLKFTNKAKELGLDLAGYSNGASYADLDNDGDQDLVVNNVNMPAFLYKNTAVESGKNYLKISLIGDLNNKLAVGSTVKVFQNNSFQVSHVMPARGFQSSVDTDLIFGFQNKNKIDSVIVYWPNQTFTTLKNIAINTNQLISYKPSNSIKINLNPSQNFVELSKNIFSGQSPEHIENIYNDFDNDRLMPHMLSNEGPKIVSGDVNNDGATDIILLGAKGQSTQLFLNKNGKYIKSKQTVLENEKSIDQISGVLFDADGDKDLDLIIGVGGNEVISGNTAYSIKYYLNDGKGNFIREILKAPQAIGQINVIKTNDYDHDGDQDIFMGAGAVPSYYGLTPRSFIFKNNGNGTFVDETTDVTGPIGMVKDAIWQDINKDGWADLIVVGEWMPITVFLNDGGDLQSANPLQNSNGWWNCIKPIDIDNDGDTDFIVGNWGENMKLKASIEKPINLYIADFDDNKKPDSILEWFTPEDEKPYPFASKVDLTAKMPFLKKQILKYSDYANKQLKDLFPAINKAQKKSVTTFTTSIIRNNGEKGFTLEKFNDEAQMSPVFAIEVADLDADKIMDIYLGGNFYKLKPEIGRHDGFDGGYFKGTGNGKFTYISSQTSGIKINGEVRDTKFINQKLFVARNNNTVLVFDKMAK